MQMKVTLSQTEIRDAIRNHVETKTGLKVAANGVSISYTKAQDARETDHMTATVKCESEV